MTEPTADIKHDKILSCNITTNNESKRYRDRTIRDNAGMMEDFTDIKWGLCKNCGHQIAEITEIPEQGKATTKRKWLHGMPILFQQICTHKDCTCGGNGFEIYGRYFENKTCGICAKGIICFCATPEPQMMAVSNG